MTDNTRWQNTLAKVKQNNLIEKKPNNILKNLIRFVFSRVFFVAAALLLQLLWLLAMVWRLNSISRFVGVTISVLSFIAVLWLVNKKINPSYKLAWTIVILAIPVWICTVYFLWKISCGVCNGTKLCTGDAKRRKIFARGAKSQAKAKRRGSGSF